MPWSSMRLPALAALGLGLISGCTFSGGQSFSHFVGRSGDKLMDGGREFRFVSFNIPNLHYVEDDMRFEQTMPFRWPDLFEMDDALATIDQLGGQVVRMYALSVKRPGDPADVPRHILGPGQFNEDAFVALDHVLAAAHRHRVRVIIPFIDQWSWWGGTAELAGFRGRKPEEFWTDPQVIDDYQKLVAFVINRRNTVTGVCYRDDRAILAWETGNELKAPPAWTRQVAAFIKGLDRNHLLLDGATYDLLPDECLSDPNLDVFQTHHYDRDPRDMIARIERNWAAARGRKPYHVGEFGFLGTEALKATIDTVIQQGASGLLLWSLRYRSREGGFYWHHEPMGGDRFKAYHWPGFEIGESFDERGLMRLLREKAYEIRGLTAPPMPRPVAPRLLAADAGGLLRWQGSVGATGYDVERAETPFGPWAVVGLNVSEAQVQYRPQFVDTSVQPGRTYYYRVVAHNESGRSGDSNTVGPVRVTHRTLVDEFWNDSRMFLKEGKLQFRENEARQFKEDCHRLAGEPGSAAVYLAVDGIAAVRVYVFSKADGPQVRLSFSADGRKFEPAEPIVTRMSTFGEKEYGFRKADLYRVAPAGGANRYVRVEFAGDEQIGRIEIEHGRAD